MRLRPGDRPSPTPVHSATLRSSRGNSARTRSARARRWPTPVPEARGHTRTGRVQMAGRAAGYCVSTRRAGWPRSSPPRPGTTAPRPPGPRKQLGLTALVFVPEQASATKLGRIETLGAELRREGVDMDEAKGLARAEAEQRGVPFFEDGAEPAQLDGYATIGDELLDQLEEPPGAVIVPTGNGALLGGIGRAVLARSRVTLRVGVVASEAPVMADSFDAGRPVESDRSGTFADGLAVRWRSRTPSTSSTGSQPTCSGSASARSPAASRHTPTPDPRRRCCRSRSGGASTASRARWADRGDRHRPQHRRRAARTRQNPPGGVFRLAGMALRGHTWAGGLRRSRNSAAGVSGSPRTDRTGTEPAAARS